MNEDNHASIPAELFYILLFVLFLPCTAKSQLNINGFGKTNIYKTVPGYSNILHLNLSGDSYSDIMLYEPSQKRFVVHKGQLENTFSKPIDKFFFYSINSIKFLQNRKSEGNLFLFVARSERIAGLSSFTKHGTLQLLNSKKFDSYPSNISIADIDYDGSNDALISGPSFIGLSILSINKLTLRETKVITKRSFSSAEFIDLNFDGYPDIAAIDLVENSIKLFVNNREGKFFESRTINYSEEIKNLKICNINNDDYEDLVFTKKNELEFLLGDSVSSFDYNMIFEFSFAPLNYEICDLNNDDINDLAIINSAKERVEVYFRTKENSLPKPTVLFGKKNLTAVKVLQRGSAKRLAAISSLGELYIVGKITDTQNTFNFVGGSSPKLYTQSNKTNFIIYGNNDGSPKLNILSGNAQQRFQSLTSIPIMYNYNNFVAEDKGYGNFNFYLFSNKSLEVVSFSGFNYSIEKKSFVPFAPPIDIRVVEDKQIEAKFAQILFNKNGLLGIENIEIEEKNIISQGIDIIDSNVVGAIISNGDFEDIHYWKYSDTTLTFNSASQYEDLKIVYTSEEFKVSPPAKPEISFSFLGSENKYLISQVRYNNQSFYYLYDNKNLYRIQITGSNKLFDFSFPEMLASLKLRKPYQYILYDKLSGSFKKADFNLQSKKLTITNYIESVGVNGYFVSKFFDNDLYLFYSDTVKNLITITKIE